MALNDQGGSEDARDHGISTVGSTSRRWIRRLVFGEPQRQHFGEYLTGLFSPDRKTVSGINREFARTTNQSCLNRFLTEVDWEVQAFNERRLDFFQQDSMTRYSDSGVIAIENVLIDHTGKYI